MPTTATDNEVKFVLREAVEQFFESVGGGAGFADQMIETDGHKPGYFIKLLKSPIGKLYQSEVKRRPQGFQTLDEFLQILPEKSNIRSMIDRLIEREMLDPEESWQAVQPAKLTEGFQAKKSP